MKNSGDFTLTPHGERGIVMTRIFERLATDSSRL